jgi:hypothetical protein
VARDPQESALMRLRLEGRTRVEVRRLAGFDRATHRVPDAVGPAARRFVQAIARGDVEQRIEALHAALRAQFGFRRQQLRRVDDVLVTPDFEVSVGAEGDAADPRVAWLVEAVLGLRSRAPLEDPRFDAVFGPRLRELVVEHGGQLDVAACIDAAEALGWAAQYPSDASWCTLTVPEGALRIEVSAGSVRATGADTGSLAALVEAFSRAAIALARDGVAVLPLRSAGSPR